MTLYSTSSSIDSNGFSASINGAFASLSSTSGISKVGVGTLNLTAPNPQLSGSLTVLAGTLAVSGNGTLPQVPNVTVSAGATFQFDNSGTNLSNRYSSLGRVTLQGGTLDLNGNAATPSTQTIGGINLISPDVNQGDTSYVSVEPSTATLTASGLVVGITS